MTDEHGEVRTRRRTAAEIQKIASEFESSGLSRSQFCRRQGMTLGTLNRYLKRMYGESTSSVSQAGLVAVEVGNDRGGGGGLVVALSNGRRIEVDTKFDGPTLQRLVQVLETM